jgi:integrase
MQTGHDLKRNKSGYWEVRYSERLPGDTRWRSRSVSTGTKDRGEAARFKNEFLSGQTRLAQVGSKPTVEEAVEAYVSAVPIQRFVLQSVRRALGHLQVDLVSAEDVRVYREDRKAAGISPSTVRRELSALSTAMNWAAKTKFGGVRKEDVPYVDKPAPGTPRVLWLNEEQEPVFHALAMGLSVGRRARRGHSLHRLTLFVGIGLDTAARKEAIEDLTWDRVDLERGRIDFRVPGKWTGNKRRAVVEISVRLLPLLEEARRLWVARGAPAGEPVVGRGAIRKAWERWVGSPEMKEFAWMTPHLMRHSWAKLNARAGVSLFDVATVLGDRYETVARNYLHDCPGNSGVVNRRF